MGRRGLLAQSSIGGEDVGEEFTFYIDASPFGPVHELKALDGMTWFDYVVSEYNTIGLSVLDAFVVYPPGIFTLRLEGGAAEKAYNLIISEYVYGVG